MGGGDVIGYNSDVLRAGGAQLLDVAGIADAATTALRAAPLDPVMFGLTAAAPAFAAALEAARAAQAGGFQQEGQRSHGLAGGAATTAGLGDELTGRTASMAGSAVPGGPT